MKTKIDLIAVVAARTHLPHERAELVVNQAFDCMGRALERGESIEIRGFGSFTVRSYGTYQGRNPRNGTLVQVKAKRLPSFKVGKELRERVQAGGVAALPPPRIR